MKQIIEEIDDKEKEDIKSRKKKVQSIIILSIIQVSLIVLKYFGLIELNWVLIITSFVWIPVISTIFLMLIFFIILLFIKAFSHRR